MGSKTGTVAPRKNHEDVDDDDEEEEEEEVADEKEKHFT